MATNDGGPAFPFPVCAADGNLGNGAHPGMSLRDWFAGMAIETASNEFWMQTEGYNPEQIAGFAYALADAMLAEREKAKE